MTLTDYMYQEKREEEDLPASIQQLEEMHEEGLITATRNGTENTKTNRMTISRKQKWEEKQLCGRFKRLINDIPREKAWAWRRKGKLSL